MKVEERDPNRSRDRKGVPQIIESTRADLRVSIAFGGPQRAMEHSLTVAALPEVHLR